MTNQGFIYKYTYPNGKIYIGQTRVSVKERHYQHMSASKDPERRTICELAIAKYGEPKVETLETIEVEDSNITQLVTLLNEAEQKWIKEFDSTNRAKGYNIQLGGKVVPSKEFVLQEEWYRIYEENKWDESIAYYADLLSLIGWKICITGEKLTKEERACWYGYKFMDYDVNRETTFNSFYKRNKSNPVMCDIGYLDPKVLEILNDENASPEQLEEAQKSEAYTYYRNIIHCAIEDHWIKDIRETIWRQVRKKQDKLLKDFFKNIKQ